MVCRAQIRSAMEKPNEDAMNIKTEMLPSMCERGGEKPPRIRIQLIGATEKISLIFICA